MKCSWVNCSVVAGIHHWNSVPSQHTTSRSIDFWDTRSIILQWSRFFDGSIPQYDPGRNPHASHLVLRRRWVFYDRALTFVVDLPVFGLCVSVIEWQLNCWFSLGVCLWNARVLFWCRKEEDGVPVRIEFVLGWFDLENR